ncbi:DUF6228 family protein [Kitasatospora sp. NPDC097643]|uniref:DUF6228 family protein n=1 Tax=Kitasatospora sp. NPDC097643 TaxID=3157230 RepID=UPI003320999D
MNHPDAGPELSIRSTDSPTSRIRLTDWSRRDAYESVFAVEAVSDGLTARVDAVRVSVLDLDGDLADFLDRLAADFRGWQGERTWHTSRLTLTATHTTGGHVHLRWTLRTSIHTNDPWECTVTTTLEAGEQLRTLATDTRAFLHP